MESEDSEAPLVAHPAQRLFDLGSSLFLTQPAPRVQLVPQEVAMVQLLLELLVELDYTPQALLSPVVAVVQLEPVAQSVSLELELRILSAPQTRLLNLELVSYQAAPRTLQQMADSAAEQGHCIAVVARHLEEHDGCMQCVRPSHSH